MNTPRSFSLALVLVLVISCVIHAASKVTTSDVEFHSSTTSISPESIIESSNTTAVQKNDGAEKIKYFTQQLSSPNVQSRLQAAEALATFGSKAKSAAPALADLLPDRVMGVQAATALQSVDPNFDIPAQTLTRLVKRASIPAEKERVKTGWMTTCEGQNAALQTLGALEAMAHPVIPDLVKLRHRNCIHEQVVSALDAIGTPDAQQMSQIAAGLHDKDPEARESAIEYLSKSAEPNAPYIRTLAHAMNDPVSGVRLAALQAMEVIHPEGEGRLSLVQELMRDPSTEIRQQTLYIVGQWGHDARSAIPLLEESLKDSDPLISLTAAKLLAGIDPENDQLISTLIKAMKNKGSAQAMQAAQLLDSLQLHDARIDAALEPYQTQKALWQRMNTALSSTSPEQLAEHSRTLKVDHVRMATAIVHDQPTHVARHFSTEDGRIYCWMDVSVSSAPATVIHRWYKDGHLHHSETLQINAPQTHIWSSTVARSGSWKVDILVPGATEPLATALFNVVKK